MVDKRVSAAPADAEATEAALLLATHDCSSAYAGWKVLNHAPDFSTCGAVEGQAVDRVAFVPLDVPPCARIGDVGFGHR